MEISETEVIPASVTAEKLPVANKMHSPAIWIAVPTKMEMLAYFDIPRAPMAGKPKI